MRIAAIICEYNPLHDGHVYHIDATRKLTNCDCLLCVMSGNFVQRGEVAVLDKYTRAKHAILAGADLVIELPPIFALSSAQFFASGAIKMLAKIQGVTHLCFGSESGNIDPLAQAVVISSSQEYKQAFRKQIDLGLSYPRASEVAYFDIAGATSPLNTPNNILGAEYIRAINAFAPHITPVTVERMGASYHDKELDTKYPSATAIRASLNGDNFSQTGIPSYVYNSLLNPPKIDMNRIFSIVADKLNTIAKQQLDNLYEGDEGLCNRLKNSLATAVDYESLLNATHTKRYTKSKIARLICHALLNHDKSMLSQDIPLIPLAALHSKADYLSILPKHSPTNSIAENINYCDSVYSIVTGTPSLRKHIELI